MRKSDPSDEPLIDPSPECLAISPPERSRPSGAAVGAVVGATSGFILCCSHVGPKEVFWTAGRGGPYTTPLGIVVLVVGGGVLGTVIGALRHILRPRRP